jgi:hypothetical protein
VADDKIQVELSIEEQKALRAITALTKKVDEFGKDAKKSFSRADAALASFAGNLAANAISKGFSLIADGFQAVFNNAEKFIDAASVQEDAVSSLNSALATTGRFSKQASQDLQNYASRLQTLTGVGDEVILKNQALIQSISRLSTGELRGATKGALDLSAALGIDLSSASSLVAKAINGKTEALGRYGIQVEKSKDKTEQYKNVIRALEGFSGAAEAKLLTFSGATGALGGRFGDLQESLGEIITKNPAVLAAINALEKGVLFLDNAIKNNKKEVNAFIEQGINLLLKGFQAATDAVIFFNKALAGFDIIGKQFTKSLLEIQLSFNEFEISLIKSINKTREFLNLEPRSEAFIDAQNEKIESTKAVIKSIDSEINAIEKRTSAENRALKGFSNLIETETKAGIERQKEAIEKGNESFLISISDRAKKQKDVEKKSLDEIALLRESFNLSQKVNEENKVLADQLKAEENFQFLSERLGREEALREIARAKELQNTAGQNAAILSLQAARAKAEREGIFQVQKFEELSQKQRLDNFKSSLGAIATLQSSSNKTLFAIGKAAAIATATIDGIQAVQKALASAPPPFNFALAALVGTAQAANLSKIASASPPKFERGGIVGGNSFSGDQVIARVNSGEMILNRQQQSQMFAQLNGQGSSGSSVIDAISRLGDRIANMNIIVQANSREIARLVRDEREAGFAV